MGLFLVNGYQPQRKTPRDLTKEEILANIVSADAGKLKGTSTHVGSLLGNDLETVPKPAPSGPATSTEYQEKNTLEKAKEHVVDGAESEDLPFGSSRILLCKLVCISSSSHRWSEEYSYGKHTLVTNTWRHNSVRSCIAVNV